MIHAIVADNSTVRVFEGSPPGKALAEVASAAEWFGAKSIMGPTVGRRWGHSPLAVSRNLSGDLRSAP